jgi:hypothetical protein
VDRVVGQDVGQRLAPTKHHRLPLGGLHGLGEKASPIDVEVNWLIPKAIEHPLDARTLGLRGIAD